MSKVISVKVQQVVIVESVIGDGKEDVLRPYTEIFDMDGEKIKTGDWLSSAPEAQK